MSVDNDINLHTQKVYLVQKKIEGLLLVVCPYIIQMDTYKIKHKLGGQEVSYFLESQVSDIFNHPSHPRQRAQRPKGLDTGCLQKDLGILAPSIPKLQRLNCHLLCSSPNFNYWFYYMPFLRIKEMLINNENINDCVNITEGYKRVGDLVLAFLGNTYTKQTMIKP